MARFAGSVGNAAKLPTTDGPDLYLLIDAQRLDGRSVGNGVHSFRLQKSPTSVRIASRAGAPDAFGLVRDPRPLDIALRQVMLWQGCARYTHAVEPRTTAAGSAQHVIHRALALVERRQLLPSQAAVIFAELPE